MNSDNYERCIKTKLIRNLPPNSVSRSTQQRNLPQCATQSSPISSRKSAVIDWLSDRGIPFSDRMSNPELCPSIKLHKPRFRTATTDALLAEHGHSVLRLPPYCPDLNLPNWYGRRSRNTTLERTSVSVLMMLWNWLSKSSVSSQGKNGARGVTTPVTANRITLRLEPVTDDIP
jgi:hypothetical protein